MSGAERPQATRKQLAEIYMPPGEFEEYQKDKQATLEKREEFRKLRVRNLRSTSVAQNLIRQNKKRTTSVMATIYGTGNNRSKNSDLDPDSVSREVFYRGINTINVKDRAGGRENIRRICTSKIDDYSAKLNNYKSLPGATTNL